MISYFRLFYAGCFALPFFIVGVMILEPIVGTDVRLDMGRYVTGLMLICLGFAPFSSIQDERYNITKQEVKKIE